MKAKIITSSLAALRQRAEELMKKKLPKTTSQLSEADSLKIRHELEVHQIELELQQEELMWAEELTAKVANERYAELCNFAPSGYFTLSKEGEIIELNLSGANMLGKESSHLKNSLFGFFVSDNTKPIFNQFLEDVFNSEVKETSEVILTTNGNSLINVFLTGIAKGNGDQCYVSAIDITERKRTENAQLNSEEKYRNIFENIQDVYYEATIDGIILEVSPSISFMSKGQYKRNDIIGKSMYDFYYVTGGRHTVLALLQERGIVTDYEIFLKNRDGSQVPCSISAKIQFDTNGKPLKIIGNMHDITERKRAEEALVESEMKYRQLVAQSPDGIFILDLSGKFISVNKTICDNLKYTEEELLSMKIWEIVPEKYQSLHKQRLVAIMSGESVNTVAEYEVKGKDGVTHFIEILSVPYYKENKIIGFQGIAHDITMRKQDEESLRQYKEQLEFALGGTNDGIWDVKLDTGSVYLSPRGCEILGYKPDDLQKIVEHWNQIVHPEDLPATNAALTAYLEGKTPIFIIEQRLKTSTGDFKWILARGKVVSYDSNGKALRMVGTHTDITEQKQAEKEITMLAHSLKSINECVSITDLDDKILFVNESFLKTYGYAENELIGKHISIVRSQNNVKELVEKILPATIHGEWQGELLNKRKDGSEFPIYLSTTIVKDKEGKTLGLIGVATDISERKQAKQLIKLLSRAIEQSPVTVMITDKKGNIEYVNPEFTELTGYKTDEVKGKNPRFLQSGLQTREFYKELWNTILSGKSWYGELLNKKKNGDSYWESALISSIVNNQGDITFFVAVMEDITEKKKMVEDLIQAKAKAEESDRLKTSFLNNISHEIRTPFNGILGFLSLIQDNNMSVSERDEYISIINKSAYRLMNTINDIVEISQIQAGQIKLIVSKTNIRELAGELYIRFITEAEIKGLKFFINKDLPNKVEWIYTDSIKLNTILSNLIGNAIKFTNTGSIVFGIRLVVDKVDEHALSLQFSVKDTGVGISENKQQAIFERFMQADGSNTRLFEGSGLGLSIAKAYVEMLNGKIWVESEEGKGSIFYFTIPYKDEPEEKNDAKNIVMNEGTENQINPEVLRLKILIVEDNEESAILLSIGVRSFGKEVIKVRNGFQAIEACRNNPDIDLVLMDLKMPDMDGYEATRQIRRFNKDVVIIAQTAYALIGDREKAVESGCNDYIAKPFNRATLGVLIEKHFKKPEKE
ncbi:MAG: PAS domain S-box protein [Bacteroidia bacterium]|nr:PAS domain S-box protein [Bacteroidia bacterium]